MAEATEALMPMPDVVGHRVQRAERRHGRGRRAEPLEATDNGSYSLKEPNDTLLPNFHGMGASPTVRTSSSKSPR